MTGKVLLLQNLGADYGSYFISRGFAELLGTENVREWPYKNTHNGALDNYPERCWHPAGTATGDLNHVIHVKDEQIAYVPAFTGCELFNHKALWRSWVPGAMPGAYIASDGPTGFMKPIGIPYATDDEIMSMLANGEFKLIILNGARWHDSAALSELQAKFGKKLPPVAFCDHEDYPQKRWDFCDAFSPNIYFKRSNLTTGHPNEFMFGHRDIPVRPLPFSSMWHSEWVPWNERKYDVFCVFGATQVMRQKLKTVTEEIAKSIPGCRILSSLGHAFGYDEYQKLLSQSKIVIDQQSFGTDTLRFWEAASAGTALISDYHVRTPLEHTMQPGVHFMQYDNDLSPSADQQDFVKFEQLLRGALTNHWETESMAMRMYASIHTNHTTAQRAQYIINEMRAVGCALGDLP